MITKRAKVLGRLSTWNRSVITKMEPTMDKPIKKLKVDGPPLVYTLVGQHKHARAATVKLPHGDVLTPVFMPVGTKGTMKGLTSEQMQQIGCKILLSNTYHLGYHPGAEFLKEVGGLHRFMNWPNNILTDSGGFQMVSLKKLSEVTEKGVKFQSPYSQTEMFIGPEQSIGIQNCIGSDIMMALDDVVSTLTQGPRVEEAMQRTLRWIDRCFDANKNPNTQNLFPIIQGAVDMDLRKRCLEGMVDKPAYGFAIGGLSGGQAKEQFVRVVRYCCQVLPKDKPRYLMGVGYLVDVVICACLGVDMFDCVFPTRTARFGTVFTSQGEVNMKNKEHELSFRPIQQGCKCETCRNYTRSYLHAIAKEDVACHLFSIHNLCYFLDLMRRMRQSIINGTVESFVEDFLRKMYSKDKKLPEWVKIGIQLAQFNIKCFDQ